MLAEILDVSKVFCKIEVRHNAYFSKGSCKIEVRHILFKKIVFLIFLNNPVTVHWARAYCLKRKKQKTFFSFQSMPNLNFAELILF